MTGKEYRFRLSKIDTIKFLSFDNKSNYFQTTYSNRTNIFISYNTYFVWSHIIRFHQSPSTSRPNTNNIKHFHQPEHINKPNHLFVHQPPVFSPFPTPQDPKSSLFVFWLIHAP